ncbi:diguanylate cyclase domain-containing protein [Inhella proteolytica]|uniref:Diguanylate cyclase n=1 Tax=Inhella proteolytica TaxID=2795029 RepID=A0A931J4T6_9BURK|nr:diguanylate cyclase [Inhella proteolytica]MBH9577798.1 diguanylate cyclase [Inhella proteolytica]
MQIAGFTLQDVIHSHGDTVVTTALDAQGQRVVLKVLDSDQPAPEQLARWRHEYALLRELDSEWVVRARELRPAQRSLVLVLEDFGPHNLAQLIERRLLDLSESLSLAIQLCHAVSAVHQARLIHGDIAPKNVLVDLVQLRLKLCDFGLATRLDSETRRSSEGGPRGTLEYLSPEQTGRTNLAVDYRSDFYSLGVTLYELFGGQRPFQASDPLALLHAQIALAPRPLHELNPQVPEALAAIVHKLLAKNPDERYQSSYGLRMDLEQCAERLRVQGRIEPFTLASQDVPERFSVAQRLIGRSAETARILAAFERVQGGQAGLLLVSGASGVGKTALVAELHRPVLALRGYFLRGKCDQYSRDQPYAALVQAFQPLMEQLALEGPERRAYWREQLAQALGEQAGAVAAIVPQLRLLIGEPPPLPALPPAENEARFHIAFGRFVRCLAGRAHPVLLFLDDLQWADPPSLRLLEQLLSEDEGACLLIVGAYRDNEVGPTHPLQELLNQLQRQRPIEQLLLPPLSLPEVAELLGDTLHCPPTLLMPLAELCFAKTAGNPFFLSQFLRRLHELGDLQYERAAGTWRWQLERIRSRTETANVVELMLTRLRGLPPDTQRLLAQAAHLGEGFSLRELMRLCEQDARGSARRLWPALAAGLVQPLGELYKFEDSPELLARARYRFLHDRVQQAAHALTPEHERSALQLECGRRLLRGASATELQDRLFVVLECLNQGLDALTEPVERAQLGALNWQAGLRAKASSAYLAASQYLRLAVQLLPPDAWQADTAGTQRLYRELAEAEYLAGRFEAAEALYPIVHAHCTDPVLRAEICLVQADQLNLQGRFQEAMPVLRAGLALVGRPFPDDEAQAMAAVPAEFAQTQALLAEPANQDWLQLPEMREPARLMEMRLYLGLTHSSYQCACFGTFLLDACRMVRTSLDHGLCDLGSVACVAYTTAMSAMKQPYAEVYRMGRAALRLAEARPDRHYRITVYQYFAPFYQHWGEPLQASVPLLDRAIELGLSGMNPLSTGYCVLLRAVNRFIYGVPLDELEPEAERALRVLQRSLQPSTEAMLRNGVLQPLRALCGRSTEPLSFDSPEFSPSDFFKGDERTPGIPLAFYSTAWLRHAYLLGAGAQWRQHAPNVPMIGMVLPDSPSFVEACFYEALGLLREGFADTPDAQARAREHWQRFDTWAQDCEANFRHRERLIAAELARVQGDERGAMNLYAQAIDAAGQAEFTVDEGLANELYARFWLSQDQKQLAANFIREAYYHYRRWGALLKCRQLEAEWQQVSFRIVQRRESLVSSVLRSTVSESSGALDLASLLKASQALAQQIHLDRLLETMLGLLLENAGAESGAIVSCDDESLLLETQGTLSDGRVQVSPRLTQPLAQAEERLPVPLIEYVQLTRCTLVLNQPDQDERFARSPYLQVHQPRSVLCLPVLAQGRLVALVYLENRLLSDAFTPRQQRTLETLAGQAAIALVNARLYESLEEKVAQRTEELRQMSMKDGLTGIANRRAFDERLALEWRRSLRQNQPLSLLMLDIDHFKQFNDHYGHVEGDRCIQAVAQALSHVAARAGDLVARYGGEEFAILLPQTDAEAAAQVAQACLQAVAEREIPHMGSAAGGRVSLSIGHATCVADAQSGAEGLLRAADQALYQAKREGRNCSRNAPA